MKKLYIITGIVMVAILLLGCGGRDAEPGRSLDDLGYDPDGLPIVEEEVSYRIVAPKNALALDYNDMLIFEQMEEDTNVNIEWENLGEESFEATRNLILADRNNLPDAMYHAGFSDRDVIQYSAAKTILPFDEYLEYMPNFSRILEERPDIERIITAPDGHIYALPRVEEMGLLQHPNLLFLNKAWVNRLSDAGYIVDEDGSPFTVEISGGGLADTSTEDDIQLDELTIEVDGEPVDGLRVDQYGAILRAIRENADFLSDADNVIPLTFVFNGWQGNQSDLYAAFGIPENTDHRTVIDDEVVFTATLDAFKDATNYYSDWVDQGLIDREVFTQGDMDLLAKGKGDHQRLGSFYWWEKETVVKPEWYDDYVAMPPLIGRNGEQIVGVSNNQEISKGNFVVFDKAENPEVLMSWIDRFYDPTISAQINYGPIGIVYEEERDDEGRLVQKPIPEGMTADELRLRNAPMGIVYLTDEQWGNDLVMEYRARLRLEILDEYADPYVPEDVRQYPNVTFELEEINDINRYASDIYDYIFQQQSTWLLEGGVTDQEWDDYVDQLERMGLNEMIDSFQSAYDRYQETG
ncbi:MAG: ABC transporter substrate-binding protein [Acholeplasmataceae bacterium]